MDERLVGREHELGRLGDFLADIPRTGGSLVLVGEPGVGKTALLAEMCRAGGAAGLRVLRSEGAQFRAQAGYGALRQLVASAPECRAAAADLPALAVVLGLERETAPGHEDVARAVLCLVESLSLTRPTLMVLDDAQWARRGQRRQRRRPGAGGASTARNGHGDGLRGPLGGGELLRPRRTPPARAAAPRRGRVRGTARPPLPCAGPTGEAPADGRGRGQPAGAAGAADRAHGRPAGRRQSPADPPSAHPAPAGRVRLADQGPAGGHPAPPARGGAGRHRQPAGAAPGGDRAVRPEAPGPGGARTTRPHRRDDGPAGVPALARAIGGRRAVDRRPAAPCAPRARGSLGRGCRATRSAPGTRRGRAGRTDRGTPGGVRRARCPPGRRAERCGGAGPGRRPEPDRGGPGPAAREGRVRRRQPHRRAA
ncbi:AAA family ATPase [Kitasatospora sp. NPDC127067]|uniref:ATP-binding protein n=1 Tax=Kitasatospora sp. NPDC127067 TaxID=3347126 RepID=UPI00364FB315